MLEPQTPALIFAPMEGLADAPMRAVQRELGGLTWLCNEFFLVG